MFECGVWMMYYSMFSLLAHLLEVMEWTRFLLKFHFVWFKYWFNIKAWIEWNLFWKSDFCSNENSIHEEHRVVNGIKVFKTPTLIVIVFWLHCLISYISTHSITSQTDDNVKQQKIVQFAISQIYFKSFR